jgi:hypothetical protein
LPSLPRARAGGRVDRPRAGGRGGDVRGGRRAAIWERLAIPGSPFAVALDLDGAVVAKGTFNNLAQLESVLAAAERRIAERELAGAAGV